MSLLRSMSHVALVAGFVLFVAGGMSVRSDPDGTWVKVTVVHAAGVGVFLVGVLLSVVTAWMGSRGRTG